MITIRMVLGQRNVHGSLLLCGTVALGVFIWVLMGLRVSDKGEVGDTFWGKEGLYSADLDLYILYVIQCCSHFPDLTSNNGCRWGWQCTPPPPCAYNLNSNPNE